MAEGGLGRAAAVLASGTFVSRILGFASALLLAGTLGTVGASANAFTLANQLPNNIYAIVAGGVLSAVLVPQIVRASSDPDGGQGFINKLVTLGLVVFLAAATVATLCAPVLVRLYAQQGSGGVGFTAEQIELATAFAYWCLPQVLFYAIYSLLGEVLNARKVFGPFTWSPALNNVVVIAGLVAFLVLFGGPEQHEDPGTWAPGKIALLAGSATLGIAVQALILFFFWKRAGLTYRPNFAWRGVGLGRTGRAAAWVFGMILVTQLAGLVQSNVATLAGSGDAASNTVLRYSWLIFMLPHSIVTVSLATAYFTRMSTHAHEGALDKVRADVSSSLRSVGLFMVFASLGLVALAYPMAAVFDPRNVAAMGNVLIAYLPGLVAFSALFVLQRVFYALEDTRTPFFLQVVQSGLFVVLALLCAQLPVEWIAVGIATSTTIAGTAQTVVALLVLRRRLGGIDAARVVRRYVQFLVAALVAAAVGVGVLALLGAFSGGFAVDSRLTAILSMLLTGPVMAGVYGGILALMRSPELADVAGPVIRRLRRR
ncbi:murein biosynthesis integral membrane protein MurJ [Desertivibrio insolitus]|uniref:murein biosynthesis integral membrane protein MurJ n=1 Tax=Herbiconiux sp. SYSU D00978 TaxID=2812562 RepID=UPI0027DABEF1|nr:murein biosynthesis integral membrane protein MurJ [Herbiconiux sp. SYSU D00978]